MLEAGRVWLSQKEEAKSPRPNDRGGKKDYRTIYQLNRNIQSLIYIHMETLLVDRNVEARQFVIRNKKDINSYQYVLESSNTTPYCVTRG